MNQSLLSSTILLWSSPISYNRSTRTRRQEASTILTLNNWSTTDRDDQVDDTMPRNTWLYVNDGHSCRACWSCWGSIAIEQSQLKRPRTSESLSRLPFESSRNWLQVVVNLFDHAARRSMDLQSSWYNVLDDPSQACLSNSIVLYYSVVSRPTGRWLWVWDFCRHQSFLVSLYNWRQTTTSSLVHHSIHMNLRLRLLRIVVRWRVTVLYFLSLKLPSLMVLLENTKKGPRFIGSVKAPWGGRFPVGTSD